VIDGYDMEHDFAQISLKEDMKAHRGLYALEEKLGGLDGDFRRWRFNHVTNELWYMRAGS